MLVSRVYFGVANLGLPLRSINQVTDLTHYTARESAPSPSGEAFLGKNISLIPATENT
jgi:hypothetical protein